MVQILRKSYLMKDHWLPQCSAAITLATLLRSHPFQKGHEGMTRVETRTSRIGLVTPERQMEWAVTVIAPCRSISARKWTFLRILQGR